MEIGKRFTGIIVTILFFFIFGGAASAKEDLPRVEQLMQHVGFGTDDYKKVLAGRIVAKELEEESKLGLALKIAVLMPAPFEKVVQYIRKGRVFDISQTVHDYVILKSDRGGNG